MRLFLSPLSSPNQFSVQLFLTIKMGGQIVLVQNSLETRWKLVGVAPVLLPWCGPGPLASSKTRWCGPGPLSRSSLLKNSLVWPRKLVPETRWCGPGPLSRSSLLFAPQSSPSKTRWCGPGPLSLVWPRSSFDGFRAVNGFAELQERAEGNIVDGMSIIEDQNGNLWTAALRAGAFKYDRQQKVHYPIKEGSTAIEVFAVYKDNRDDLWLGTHNGGAYKFNGTTFEKFRP